MSEDWADLDATGQAELVRNGEASPAELVDAAIERIEALNPELNAVIHPLYEKARAAAEGELPEGPFKGVPFLVKDLMCTTEGDPYCEGTKFLKEAGFRAPHDSYLAKRFREAGFVICGKTNTPEFGILPTTEPDAFGPSRNPWNPGHSTGGSSGGSAAAVAAGMVPVAHANDGGGSIRIPASTCGLVGLKPSRGRITQGPDVGDVMSGLVNELVVSRSVRDTAAVLEAVHGAAAGDPYVAPHVERPYTEEVGADPGKLNVLVMTASTAEGVETHPENVAGAEGAATLLESLGHHVQVMDQAMESDPEFVNHFMVRWFAGNTAQLNAYGRMIGRELGPDDVEPLTWALAEAGKSITGPDYLTAVAAHQAFTRQLAQIWENGVDLLLTPTTGEPPPPLGSFQAPPDNPLWPMERATPLGMFTAIWNITGQPAISLPLHMTEDGLPIGVQLVGAYGREDLLIRVAAQLEEAAPWADRRPAVFAGAGAAS